MVEQLYTPGQVAELFQVTPYTIREWLKDGTLRGIKPGGRWRIPESAIEELATTKFGESDAGK
jgi:excisionase family DNA binding protein